MGKHQHELPNLARYPWAIAFLGIVNAIQQLIVSFGIQITTAQQVAITGTINAALILAISIYLARIGTRVGRIESNGHGEKER